MKLVVKSFLLLAISAGYVAAQVAGVGNFAQVQENVYRGGQPTAEGFENLARLGVKVIVDLRGGDERGNERAIVERLGMRYIHEPLPALAAPPDESVERVLALLNSAGAANSPVFVHCMRGKDRTGLIMAAYRIRHDGWTNDRALTEAKSFGMSRLERSMQRYILQYNATVTSSGGEKKIAAAP